MTVLPGYTFSPKRKQTIQDKVEIGEWATLLSIIWQPCLAITLETVTHDFLLLKNCTTKHILAAYVCFLDSL